MRNLRAEVIGSLLRPDWLKKARKDREAGTLSLPEFKKIEDRAVREAVAVYEKAGVDVVTDGEQRRTNFLAYLTDALSGINFATTHDFYGIDWKDAGDKPAENGRGQHITKLPVVTSRLARAHAKSQEEFSFLRAITDKQIKATIPSPLMAWSFYSPELSHNAYSSVFEMFFDIAKLIRQDILELRDLGCTYVQIDAPELAIVIDPEVRERVHHLHGLDMDGMLTDGVRALDAAVADIDGVTKCLHICRGNNAGAYFAKGGYEAISKAVFAGTKNFDRFSLEYDDDRSGSFEPLRDVPDDKEVILGVVSTKRPALENIDALVQRVDTAAKYFPKDQLAVSPQCGFASILEGNPLTAADQAAKLKLVRDLADRIWG